MSVPTPDLYALLIAIDAYLPNRLPDGSSYRNLGGCVRDITHVETFLQTMRNVPADRILKLTASVNPNDITQPLESPEHLPTRQNIIAQFRKLGEMAPAGAQVYIHFSGHGGRAKTIFPEIKGETAIDEGLVPTDIGTSQYIRDLELAQLLKELADRGLTVTLVLDCCHSGGATRGDVEIRGSGAIDDKPLSSTQELVASLATLATLWQDSTQQGTRALKASGLPESENYVVLAACRPNEFAYEYAFNRETKERNGALTYWLLDTLRQQHPGQTYKDLYDRINAKIHSQFPQQTPMLMGEGNRSAWGNTLAEVRYAVPVIRVEADATGATQAILAVGQSAGVSKGAEFAIYPRGADLSNPVERVAIAQIVQRGAAQSVCHLKPIQGQPLQVEQGDQAVLISPSINLIRKVWLDAVPPDQLPDQVYASQSEALNALVTALQGNRWIEVATEQDSDDDPIAYQVRLNAQGEYIICDRTGAPFANVTPAVHWQDFDAAAIVVKRLVHLAKYHAALELDNTDKTAALAGKVTIEWLGTSDTYEAGDPIPPKSRLTPFADPSQPTVREGEYIFLSLSNTATQALNLTVLNFGSDWSVEQIHPSRPGELFVTLDPGQKETIPLSPTVEGSSDTVENTTKVFATLNPANFRWLELPSLDEQLPAKSFTTRSGSPLEALLSAIDAEQPATRKLTVAASPSQEWTTRQILLTITR
ncbi:caspase family protein [Egbenema bharatensis]|uniref:caspase family protein n=1 Tax=Egbenema bharatensis TaxID=3463334 RepID=UPI003A8745CB